MDMQGVITNFTQNPQDRVVAAFFLGLLLFCATVLFFRATAWAFLGYRLRRLAPATGADQTLQERLEHLEATQGLPPDAIRDFLVKVLGGRQGFVSYHEGLYTWPCLVIILSFGLSSISHLVTLVTFSVNNDVPCAFFVALGGICVETAYIGGVYEIGTELMNIGASNREYIILRIVLILPLVVAIVGQALSTGSIVALPTAFPPDSGLCFQAGFIPTAATLGALNLLLSLYAFTRFFLHLAPAFLSFEHRFQALFDVRIVWALSLILFELLTFVPTMVLMNYAVTFIPFSVGGIVVMVAFSFYPTLDDTTSTISVLPSEAALSSSGAMDTGTARLDLADHGRAGYEEYKRRWSRPLTAPLRLSSPISPLAEEKRRASYRTSGSSRHDRARRSHSSPAGVHFQTVGSVLSQVREAEVRPVDSGSRSVRPFSTHIEHPHMSNKESLNEPRSGESAKRRDSIFKSLPALPDLPPVTLSDGTKRSFVDLSKRQSFRLSPPQTSRPRLILHIPSTSTVQASDGHSPTRSPNSSEHDDGHQEARTSRGSPTASSGIVPWPSSAPVRGRPGHRRDPEAQTPDSSSAKKGEPRSRRSSKHIVVRGSDMPVSKRISIGASGDVVIEIAEPQPSYDALRVGADHPLRSASSPRPRGPRAPPQRQTSRQMPRTAPHFGKFQEYPATPS